MADLVYQKVMKKLKEQIRSGQFTNNRLPDERTLSETYQVSRSSIKRALSILAQQGVIFKKRGSGTFVNPLYLKNKSIFRYEGSNLGITNNLKTEGYEPSIRVLDFQVIPAPAEVKESLFLQDEEFVYEIKRLRLLNDQAIIIETSYIPIKIAPALTREIVAGSLFAYFAKELHHTGTKAVMSLKVEPSNANDQELLHLTATEPVGIMEGIFFLDNGTPFELSKMRVHYSYFSYNTFVDLPN
ncbi:GntR family transcriptional regulator [Fructilactobacillus cliffordii]|uniref:GntR family transcriptional regulator n=1 Tax=Fructilactobacillus cliffordii TaxID=2940299 RepID=A0A9Q8ZRG1_9LACO|nr:GntR family transcriptional regulator [Fructilactobacillus cliffordii]USS86063.1 GntR family transcriptional regulator [Fructilactobacillus cliffordii]USS89142.1 GntR family transcriptional regulator [Fructilactobacillus cliffordii]